MGIMFGGDAESFMEAPRMENKSLSETLGFSPIAALLDLVGVNKQVAKGPKEEKGDKKLEKTPTTDKPANVAPSVLNDVSAALSQPATPITPVMQDAPMTPWGKRWMESNRPLLPIDPNDFLL